MISDRQKTRDVIVIGGGLAGLSLAKLLSEKGVDVLLIEKGQYPRNKVCGEYISCESEGFLNRLGLNLREMDLPRIRRFQLTFPHGKKHQCKLDPGGMGLSRLTLDHRLYQLLEKSPCQIILNTRVTSVESQTDHSLVHTSTGQSYRGKIILGASGREGHSLYFKRSKKTKKARKYFGLKYHIHGDFPDDLIQINLFSGGYAGLSKVEGEKYCFCYLANADLLKKFKGSVDDFEKNVLTQNPVLSEVLADMQLVNGPVTTARFQFDYFGTQAGSTFLAGDTAGFIPPLTGNGMSLAFRSASVLGNLLGDHFEGKINRMELEEKYKAYGLHYLKKRIHSGLFLQELALNSGPTGKKIISGSLSLFPFLLNHLSRKARGKNF